jgi:hypothetical protein
MDCDPVYVGENFKNTLREKQISVKLSAVGVHQQNGKAEVTQRVMYNGARCLLAAKNLKPGLWGFALKYLSHTTLMIPQGNNVKSPFEMYSGFPPDISHLRVFGSLAIAKLQTADVKSKFQVRGAIGTMVGYSANMKESYTVMDLKFPYSTRERGDVLIVEDFQALLPFNVSDHTDTLVASKSEWESEDDSNLGYGLLYDAAKRERQVSQLRPGSINFVSNDSAEREILKDVVNKGQFSHAKAMKHAGKVILLKALREEYDSLNRFGMFTPIDGALPDDSFVVGISIYYKVAEAINGLKIKCRMVLRGDQLPKELVLDTYSPTVQGGSVNVVLLLSQKYDMKRTKLDITSAYAHAKMNYGPERTTLIIARLPKELSISGITAGLDSQLAIVEGALYGHPESGRLFNEMLNGKILSEGSIQRSVNDPALYFGNYCDEDGEVDHLYVTCHVDDMGVFGSHPGLIEEFKGLVSNQFELKDEGSEASYLSMELRDSVHGITITQGKYCENLKEKYGIRKARAVPGSYTDMKEHDEVIDVKILQERVGAIRYAADHSRPDVLYAATASTCDLSGDVALKCLE